MLKKILLAVVVVSFGLAVFATGTPSNQLKFETLVEHPIYKLEIAPSTKSSMKDEDGDTLTGITVRVTPVVPIELPNGSKVGSFINFVVAVCGHNGLILARSEMFALDGTALGVVERNEVLLADAPDSPTTHTYIHLCGKLQPQKRDTGRNTSLWT